MNHEEFEEEDRTNFPNYFNFVKQNGLLHINIDPILFEGIIKSFDFDVDIDVFMSKTGIDLKMLLEIGNYVTHQKMSVSGKPLEEAIEKINELFKEKYDTNRHFKSIYNQFPVTIDSCINLLKELSYRIGGNHLKILFIGFEHPTILGISTLLNSEVTVVDIDNELLRRLKDISGEKGIELETINLDVYQNTPAELREKYDIVFFHGYYTENGFLTFAKFAMECIKPKYGSRLIYHLYPYYMDFESLHKIQNFIISNGFEILKTFSMTCDIYSSNKALSQIHELGITNLFSADTIEARLVVPQVLNPHF